MAGTNLPNFPGFPVHSDPNTVGSRWTKYIKRIENMFVGFSITDDKQQRALLLHFAGEEVADIFDTLPDTGSDYKTASEKLTSYFAPKQNIEFERFIFRGTKQLKDEVVDTYHTRLQKLAQTCDFSDKNAEIKSQIIQGCISNKLRRRALQEKQTLESILDIARSMELTEIQATGIEKSFTDNLSLNSIQNRDKQHRYDKARQKQHGNKQKSTQCYMCGNEYPHAKKCPAEGQTCNFCGKQNHFSVVCKSRKQKPPNKRQKGKVHAIAERKPTDSSSDEENYVFTVKQKPIIDRTDPQVTIKFDDTPVQVIIDTGASVNIVSQATYNQLRHKPKLNTQTKSKLFGYGNPQQLDILGTFETELKYKTKKIKAEIFVTTTGQDNLLSYASAAQIGLIYIVKNIQNAEPTTDSIIRKYNDRFVGIGNLRGVQCTLHVDKSIKPVTQQHRRVPFHVRKQTETELKRLQDLDIIEPVGKEPTPWVSPIQVVKKPKQEGQVRICVDMRAVNKSILRERHITPTIDDIITDLTGSTIFSKLDLNSGYHQIELAPESRYLTVFTTHAGLFRYKRLNFGVSSAAEIFQNLIQTSLQGLEGVLNISDDILIHANNQVDHDKRLDACLQRIREKNLTLNQDKCQFNKERIEFFGHVFSSKGISPDPKKVTALKEAAAPSNIEELRSFLGMATYCGRFIPNLATITEPLRNLTKDSTTWQWGFHEAQAFKQVQDSIVRNCTMAYFDPTMQTELVVDASPFGLAALLAQRDTKGKQHIVALASRSLTNVEQRYSQTEREALAVTWSILHFHLYLYGNNFRVISDHKPLIPLFNNPVAKMPTRIERWILKLQEYTYILEYQPGKQNPADYLSRHPLPCTRQSTREEKMAEEHINFISEHATPKTILLGDIKAETLKDETLQTCISALRSGKWQEAIENAKGTPAEKPLRSLHHIEDELSFAQSDNILLRGNRIVIPKSLQQTIMAVAHEGHQGVVKTKKLLREKVWFPDIDHQAEQMIKNCIPCQACTVDNSREPLTMSELPAHAWLDISIDFCDLPTGEHLLVLTDDYSRYPIVEIVNSTSARTVIPVLDRVFAMFGVPQTVRTDNGPPFNSSDFAKFAMFLGFKHRKITPRWPRANGEVERFMKTLKKTYRTAIAEGKSWKQQLFRFLHNYRATPHTSTGVAPASALFRHPIRTRIPEIAKANETDDNFRDFDRKQKDRMKHNADKRENTQKKPISVSDTVLIRRDGHVNKADTPYHPKPYHVTDVKGSMITAKRGDHIVTRNSSHFKKLLPQPITSDSDTELDFELSVPDAAENPCINYRPPRRSNAHIIPPRTVRTRQYRRRARNPPSHLKEYVT